MIRASVVCLLGGLVLGCAPRTVPETEWVRGEVEVGCCGHADRPVELTYLGVGGWIIRSGETAVMTAPLFSNPSLFEVGLGPIHADPDRIEGHLPDVSDVTAILVGHGHYDHLMDVPYVARDRAPDAVVYGNRTTRIQLEPFGLAGDRVQVVTDAAGTAETPGRWIRIGPGVRIMPLLSDHAPHFSGHVLYSGARHRRMEAPPDAADEWLDGETLAFLIDVLNDDGSVALRIYYQDAVAAAPFGFIPPLDGVPVDVALIVPATYAEVEWHPEALLDNLRPRHVLLCHWEDFFQAPSRPPEAVPFTLLGDFTARLDRVLPDGVGWDLPVAGARFVFR